MFINRNDAAQQLTKCLEHLKSEKDPIVFAIPRGGLPIGAAVAKTLYAPLDVILVKKITTPLDKELAIGAASPFFYFVDTIHKPLPPTIEHEIEDVQMLLGKRALVYRQSKNMSDLSGKTAIIVDDGVATGHTMHAAIRSIQQLNPTKIIIATPVISTQAADWLKQDAAEVISVLTPSNLTAIGAYYQNFDQVTDQEALSILHNYKRPIKEISK